MSGRKKNLRAGEYAVRDNIRVRKLKKPYIYSVQYRQKDESGHWKWSSSKQVHAESDNEAFVLGVQYLEDETNPLNKNSVIITPITTKTDGTFLTINEMLREHKLRREDAVAKGLVKQKTLDIDIRTMNQISDYIGTMHYKDITTDYLIDLYHRLKTDGVSGSKIRKFHVKLKTVFTETRTRYQLSYNPFDALPREYTPQQPAVSQEKKKRRRITLADAQKLKGYLDKKILDRTIDGYEMAIYIALVEGFRKGELLFLDWEHTLIDDFDPVILIVGSADSNRIESGTKREASERTNPISPQTVYALQTWRTIQQYQFKHPRKWNYKQHMWIDTGNPLTWTESSKVFTDLEGKPINPWTLDTRRQRLFVKLGFGKFVEVEGKKHPKYIGPELHSLRRTYVTTLINTGYDLETVRDMAGHASFLTTMTDYAESVDDTKRKAASDLTRIYGEFSETDMYPWFDDDLDDN